jgi:hypothetical protein
VLNVIPAVFLMDLLWLGVVGLIVAVSPTRPIRRLAWIMCAYVACEALLHVYMERAAAWVMGRF